MKQVKGIVKKYSREYTRTLKDGKRKTYKTEQVQITIPKHNNIFDDKEEVLILPYSEDFIEKFEKLDLLDGDYSRIQQENKELKEKLSNLKLTNDNLNEEINHLQNDNLKFNDKINNLESENVNLKDNCINLENDNQILKDKNHSLQLVNTSLNEKLDIKNFENSRFNDREDVILELQNEYINLLKKYEYVRDELYSSRCNEISNEYVIKRLKHFILTEEN